MTPSLHPSSSALSNDAPPPRRLREFFRYHGLWAPGVRLFRAIGFRAKALTITAVFLVPIVWLMVAHVDAALDKIRFVERERAGIVVMSKFSPVLHGVLHTRNATRALLGGHDASGAYDEGRRRTDTALAQLAETVAASGDPLGLSPAVRKLQDAWTATADVPRGVDAKGRTVFGPVSAAAVELLNEIGDRSNLVLDPDLDSFYLVNALVLTLPKTAEEVGQLWGWGTYAAARGSIGTENETKWHVWAARAEAGVSDIRQYAARAIAANASLARHLDLAALDEVMALRKAGHAAVFDATATAPAAYFAQGAAAVDGLFGLYGAWLPQLDALLAAREARQERNLAISAVVLAFALVAAGYLFRAFQKVLEGGLREVAFHIDAMRDGDLTTEPRPWGADEAARLMTTLGQMQQSLRHIVVQVRQTSDLLVANSVGISDGARDLQGRTEQSAASLQQTASAMEQISGTVQSHASSLEQAADLAGRNADAADRGGRIIRDATGRMHSIHEAAGRIRDITTTIDGIAFQTNILALNAAVEAARAGEQGRGFAVVAEEVRSLAHRASTSAREIKTLISGSMDEVEHGVRVVREAGDAVDDIVGAARHVRQIIGDVAGGAQQQTAGIEQSAHAVQQLDAITQQNAALVEQTAATAAELRQQAERLAAEVARFKVAA